jgi:D-inositol-3-phosphate glycosyltransferase
MSRTDGPTARVAIVSLHTSPLDPPGAGDAGGMNVEIRAVAERLSDRGVEVDVFTRCSGRSVPEIDRLAPLARVIQVQSGPCAPVAKGRLDPLIPGFAEGILRAAGEPYDVVHAHYWLSAPAATVAASHWGAPVVVSFHTLGEVKNRFLADGDVPEPLARLAGEREAVRTADLVVAPTETEAGNLRDLYGADPDRVAVVPPGVDHSRFFPRDRREARRRLGLDDRPVVLFLGRLQPLKGPDVAIAAFAEARRRTPALARARLLVVGGPSGADGEAMVRRLGELAMARGVSGSVSILGPREHADLPWVYAASDVLMMPSRSESFGLTALEAQACGIPVIAADVGGLPHVVASGESGVLVAGGDVTAHAQALSALMSDEDRRRRLARGAVANAARFGWDATVDALLQVYDDLAEDRAAAAAS